MASDNQIVSYNTLRRIVGWSGIIIAPSMYLINFLFGCRQLITSNSEYYYTFSGNIFTGVLFVIGVFLITYKGYSITDSILSLIAGISAIGISLFPANNRLPNNCDIIMLPINHIRNNFHLVFAGIFFLSLSIISFFIFTKSDKDYSLQTSKKQKRNLLYKSSGILIFIGLIVIAICWKHTFFIEYRLLFFIEWIMLTAFGLSWLVKGGGFLKDDD